MYKINLSHGHKVRTYLYIKFVRDAIKAAVSEQRKKAAHTKIQIIIPEQYTISELRSELIHNTLYPVQISVQATPGQEGEKCI